MSIMKDLLDAIGEAKKVKTPVLSIQDKHDLMDLLGRLPSQTRERWNSSLKFSLEYKDDKIKAWQELVRIESLTGKNVKAAWLFVDRHYPEKSQ
ncbi:MAG: hypothetical protein JRI80_19525 [Deltaproteobacteria bacterium]|nr:hypothetical protein [Deltaproteobacteria bacterium]